MNLEENYYKNNFTKEDNKTNLNINKLEVNCITSNKNNFNLDEEGNLIVKSIAINNMSNQIDLIYPIGAIFMSISNINPNTYFGGSWEQIKDRFLLGCSENHPKGSTGGEESHTLTVNEIPKHYHEMPIQAGFETLERQYNVSWIDNQQGNQGDTTPTGTRTSQEGGNQPHNNMPPYLAVYIWKRVA